jgi:hypothetical protein
VLTNAGAAEQSQGWRAIRQDLLTAAGANRCGFYPPRMKLAKSLRWPSSLGLTRCPQPTSPGPWAGGAKRPSRSSRSSSRLDS